MPRTPQGPGDTYSVRVPTCNCDADPADRSFGTAEGHSTTCPAHLSLLKQREGDQPLPIRSTSPDISDLVVVDLEARKKVGISRYGRALQAHNGRDAMRDAYEEALDLCNYLRQMIYERDGK